MSNWSEGQIYTNGVNLHYYRTGGDKPPVVLLHGFTDSGLCWTRVARDLEQDYDVVMFDARGHGLSDGPVNGFSLKLMTEDAANIIQTLELERPFLLGHSMGAATTAQVAAYHPDLVRAIALEDPPWHDFKPQSATTKDGNKAFSFEEWIEGLKTQTREERIAAGKKSNPSWSEEELGPWADSKEQLNMDVFKSGLNFEPWREIIPRITSPTLLITADPARGAIVGPEDVREIERTWYNGRVLHIDGAGHNIRREQYITYIAAVKSFFKEH
jgi:pimeloyl-ACP methyl ester carboxylesterase